VADTLATISTPTGLNVSSLEEWVKLARSSPGKLNAAGAAGVPELHLTAYLKDNDLDVVKVPYRDVVQAGRDLADSRLQLRVSSYGVAQPHVEAGRLRILALGASKRSQIAPTIASAVEAGYPVLSMETTTGLYGPPSMPLELRERIAADVMETIADPTVSQRLRDTGQAPRPGGPEAMIATLKQQETAAAAAAKIARIEARR
jgi:tripartite-type tricarboxylate transporter receptor subunit TctC